ncbi:LNS2-domain-containing protein [Piedraia hortae CBS 480.64]|uniref:LNS2-domain-containing protein n=1 Tax=Piedraia hortae CBS 480.64 TaxID=1314780 RepID=A0A6A7BVW5_9PEZI|nr:LNS2-domain-containing protein [Piedraia hortae CBS 480.64]
MQYVRSISSSVSSTWNSINPATLSGAIDVIVVEQEDSSLACSPFHIRFGKFQLLRPFEKKVVFNVNGRKIDYPMKLGEGGEAFFVFETKENVPAGLRTSPPTSPMASPQLQPTTDLTGADPLEPPTNLPELSLEEVGERSQHRHSTSEDAPRPSTGPGNVHSSMTGLASSDHEEVKSEWKKLPLALHRIPTDSMLPAAKAGLSRSHDGGHDTEIQDDQPLRNRSEDMGFRHNAKLRAMNLSRKLWASNIPNQVNDSGDLMLDTAGSTSSEGEALQAEMVARQLLSDEIDGPYDIGALIGADEKGNIWIYSSEEAKEAATMKATAANPMGSFHPGAFASSDAISDPGYHSDDGGSETTEYQPSYNARDSDSAVGLASQPNSPGSEGKPLPAHHGDPNKNYAKTLRLTSEQLRSMELQPGANPMSFTVNKATVHANLWYWHHSVPIVISDIDGTITKSDVLGHVFGRIGRDWTHQGVAKLFSDISVNGYNFLYLTSRSVGLADTTRTYLDGVVQDGYRLPKGPVILSPDRTIAALRREIYLRKPEIFKMACLRDIMALFVGHGGTLDTHSSVEAGLHAKPHCTNVSTINKSTKGSPFYAGFGNRLTDALSYRSVNIPSTRIFTINTNSEVSMDLLSLNTYKMAYGSMREIVDHYFPPVDLLVKGGGEEFTDFNYWRDQPLDVAEFTDSESESEDGLAMNRINTGATKESIMSEDEAGDGDNMLDSYLSEARLSLDDANTPEHTENHGKAASYHALKGPVTPADEEDNQLEYETTPRPSDYGSIPRPDQSLPPREDVSRGGVKRMTAGLGLTHDKA